MQQCPICNKPVESNHPEADVYHMACLMEVTKHLREKQDEL